MELRINVLVNGIYWDGGASVIVPDLLVESFNPVDKCDDAFIAGIVGGETYESMERVIKLRKDAAEILSRQLTELLIREMSKNDTHNGYKENIECP